MSLGWIIIFLFSFELCLLKQRDTCNLIIDDTAHGLAGRWKYSEEFIEDNVKEITTKIQSLKSAVIVWGGFNPDDIHVGTVDTVNYPTQEFRLGKHKSSNLFTFYLWLTSHF